jgi:hypothetical protein
MRDFGKAITAEGNNRNLLGFVHLCGLLIRPSAAREGARGGASAGRA